MKRKTLIIGVSIVGSVAVVVILAVVVALNVVNNRAEEKVNTQLKQTIEQSPMAETLSYDSVNVQAALGQVEVLGAKFEDDGILMRVDKVTVELPRGEAVAFARNPHNTTITDIKMSAFGLTLSDESEEIAFDIEEVGVNFQGNIPTALFTADNPEIVMEKMDPGVTYVSMNSINSSFKFPEDTGTVTLGRYDFNVSVDVKVSDLMTADIEGDYTPLLRKFNSFSVELSDFGVELVEARREEILTALEGFVGPIPLMKNPENWKIESFALSGGIADSGIELSNIAGKSNLIEFQGAGSMSLSSEMEPVLPLDIKLNVAHYHRDFRPFFEMFAQQFAQTKLPDGNSFEFSVSVPNDESMPKIMIK